MKIFLSHDSRNKPLLREFRSHLPSCLNAWIDENQLNWGDSLEKQLREAINEQVDYVIIFLFKDTLNSKFVQMELNWALEREKALERIFVLPIVCERDVAAKLPPSLNNRLHLTLPNFKHTAVVSLAKEVGEGIFELVVNSLQKLESQPINDCAGFSATLQDVAKNLSSSVEGYQSGSRQHSFLCTHAKALVDSAKADTQRLARGEIVTDYDDMSLVTTYVKDFKRNDELLGLTDWDMDHEWWSGVNARRFRAANKRAVQKGAVITRIFVYSATGDESGARLKALEREMKRHADVNVKVYKIERNDVPDGTQALKSQCVLLWYDSRQKKKWPWLAYNVEVDAHDYPVHNIFFLDEYQIDQHCTMLKSILADATRYKTKAKGK